MTLYLNKSPIYSLLYYNMFFLPATHRGRSYQAGQGFGGVWGGLVRFLTPLFSKGASLAARAYQHPAVKELVKTAQDKAISTGVNAINKLINPKKAPPDAPTPAPIPAKKKKFDPKKRASFKTKQGPVYSKKKDPHALF